MFSWRVIANAWFPSVDRVPILTVERSASIPPGEAARRLCCVTARPIFGRQRTGPSSNRRLAVMITPQQSAKGSKARFAKRNRRSLWVFGWKSISRESRCPTRSWWDCPPVIGRVVCSVDHRCRSGMTAPARLVGLIAGSIAGWPLLADHETIDGQRVPILRPPACRPC